MGGIDWEILVDSLVPAGLMFVLLFLLYIGFFFCVVTNTLTSLFVEASLSNADKDQRAAEMGRERERERERERSCLPVRWFARNFSHGACLAQTL